MNELQSTISQDAKDLSAWLERIESFHPEEIKLGLSRIKDIARLMDLLSPKAKVITVAGTNGKGSCVATLESLALQSNLKVACYTSPHLMVFNERIRVNGANISDRQLNNAFDKIEICRGDTALTFFEFTTLAALQIFSTKKLDLIVLEVGLGGRLDAVNIIEPDVAIITTIAKDHTDWLGNSLEEIAAEKAGIYRFDSLNLVGDEKTFNLLKASLTDSNLQYELIESNQLNSIVSLDVIHDSQINIFQLKQQNIELALTSFINLFKDKSQNIDLKQIFNRVAIAARFQTIQNKPQVIIDVAHNPQAALNLSNQIESLQCNGNRIAICGLMSDKAISEYIQILSETIDIWIFVDLPSQRGALAKDLMDCLIDVSDIVNSQAEVLVEEASVHKCFNSISLACDYVDKLIAPSDQLYVIGSFITVSEFLKLEKEFN
ncbi:MAG: dihydrofolate synthase/folylpolyglutamate synthase [Polaribacter sp.]|jgi:dihydrofolate synthase/folylpolyglutamate synthase